MRMKFLFTCTLRVLDCLSQLRQLHLSKRPCTLKVNQYCTHSSDLKSTSGVRDWNSLVLLMEKLAALFKVALSQKPSVPNLP